MERWNEKRCPSSQYLFYSQLSHSTVWVTAACLFSFAHFCLTSKSCYPVAPSLRFFPVLIRHLLIPSFSINERRLSWKEMLWLIPKGWSWPQIPPLRWNHSQLTKRHPDTPLKGAWMWKEHSRARGERFFPVAPQRGGKASREDGERLRLPCFDPSLQPLNSQKSY